MVDEKGNTKRIGVTRIHIEEDAGKLLHDESFAGSLVDFNRCGVTADRDRLRAGYA